MARRAKNANPLATMPEQHGGLRRLLLDKGPTQDESPSVHSRCLAEHWGSLRGGRIAPPRAPERRAHLRRLTCVVLLSAACASACAAPAAPRTPTRRALSGKVDDGARRSRAARPTPGSAQATAPAHSAAKAAVPNGAVGTPGPVWTLATSPGGQWVVACQARTDTNRDGVLEITQSPEGRLSGDDAVLYWIQGAGPGEPIDAWLGQSPNGRFVAFERGGRVEILDTSTGRSFDMTSRDIDGAADRSSRAEHRAISFSPDDRRVVFIRRQKGRDSLAIMDLESGDERHVEVGDGRIWRVSFAADPDSVGVWLVREDKNGNGRLDWPVPTLPPGSACRSGVQRYSAWLDYGDPATLELVRLNEAQAPRLRQGIATLGTGIVERTGDGVLRWTRPGQVVQLSDAKCGGTLLHVDPVRSLALVACSAAGVRAPVLLVGPDTIQALPIDVPASRVDYLQSDAPRLVPLYPGAGTVVVDLDRRRMIELEAGDGVLAVLGARALVRSASTLAVIDTTSRKRREVATDLPDFGQLLVREPLAYAEPYFVDLGRGKVVGHAWGPIGALANSGAYLVADTPASPATVAQGPLYWVELDESAETATGGYQVTASTKTGPSNGI